MGDRYFDLSKISSDYLIIDTGKIRIRNTLEEPEDRELEGGALCYTPLRLSDPIFVCFHERLLLTQPDGH